MQVSEAVCLDSLSYHEAWELSYFGANVLHPRTTMPAMKYDIPIVIRNFFNQTAPGAHAGPRVSSPPVGPPLRSLALHKVVFFDVRCTLWL